MKRRFVAPLTMLVLLASQIFSMSKTDSRLSAIQAELKLLETWVEAQQQYRDIPGISIGLVYDQELIYAKGFGFADLEQKSPVNPDTPFRMASITKTFTATAILQLRDAGKLRLDDPVVNYLPWFNIKQSYPDQPPITIRHLLTHTSGLPREADFPYWTDHNFPTMEQIKATLATQETIYPPATQIKYSNLGLSLAGEIVAATSGDSYENYIRSHILEPLGMTGSAVIPDESYQHGLVTPYGHRLEGSTHEVEEYTETKGIAAAASLASTVTDLANYVSLQFRENDNAQGVVVKGSTLKEMHRVQFL
ncbi:MAG: beta-lactamase family protein, partial [Candidatus Marinimicrobia bacterium]|nr:beta-lactamase family protein [Candidatus Neomarinimicrobiota bacterium]